ncbi:hypothetical protein Q9233_005281 [Columba guinea]|nr:hypothetical protein Q9233_005281 [Columba guinea]
MPRSDWLVASPERTFRTPRHNILLHCSKMATVIHNPLKAQVGQENPFDNSDYVFPENVNELCKLPGETSMGSMPSS